MNKFKAFLARKNIAFSAKRYFIDAMGAMAQGLFCTLLVGTILNTLGTQLHIGFLTESIVTIGKGEGAVAYTIGSLCSAMVGPGMAVAIGRALEAPPLVLFSLIPVGFATNSMGGAGGPLAVLFVTILASELGKAVSKETKIDILVTPIVTVLAGIGFAALIAAPVGKAASAVGQAIMWATELQPFFMGIIVSVVIGVALTLPISSAAICLALGLTEEEVNSIVPVSKMKQLAKQRTGANDQNSFYKLNPDVSDLPDKLAKNINGVKLLVMGTVDTGGSGCVCPEHVMLKAILTNLVFRRDDVVIMDMEAGLEHLGRGTASMMDQFIVVIEPGARSVQTYVRIKELAKDIGVTKVRVVANKIRDESDREFIRSRIPADDLLGFISYSPTVIDADRKGLSPYDCSPDALDEIRAIKAAIDAKE